MSAGRTVLCARFADSTLAYQGYGAGIPLEQLRALEAVATDGLRPDLTILLDLPVEAGLTRKAPGDVNRFEAEFDLAFHRRVREGFVALAVAEPTRFVVMDAARSHRRRGDSRQHARSTASSARGEPKPFAIRTHP